MPRPHVLTAVDVGSAKVAALVVEIDATGGLHHLGSGSAVAEGIQQGTVTDTGAAASSIARALQQASAASGITLSHVLLGSSIPAVSYNRRGTSSSIRPNRPVSREDARRAVAASADLDEIDSRTIVHAIPRRFLLDRETDVRDPIGLPANRIDADVHLVTLPTSKLDTLIKCVESCGVDVSQVVSQPIAAAHAVLTVEERERGVAIVDIGFAGTQLAVFIDGCPWHTASIPMGGKHITQDLAILLRLSYESADTLKISTGCDMQSIAPADEMMGVLLAEEDTTVQVPNQTVLEIIAARVGEIVGLIGEEIRQSGYAGLLPGGLVITGGTSCMSGIARLISQRLQTMVRIGHPETMNHTEFTGPAHASVIGLIRWHLAIAMQNWWTFPPGVGLSTGAGSPIRPATQWWRSIWSLAREGTRITRELGWPQARN